MVAVISGNGLGPTQTIGPTPATWASSTYDANQQALNGMQQLDDQAGPYQAAIDAEGEGALALAQTAMQYLGNVVASNQAIDNQDTNGGLLVGQNPFTQGSNTGNPYDVVDKFNGQLIFGPALASTPEFGAEMLDLADFDTSFQLTSG